MSSSSIDDRDLEPLDGWDPVDAQFNFARLKSADRRSTILVKEIQLADSDGRAYRIVLYTGSELHSYDGEHVDELIVESAARIVDGVLELLERSDL